MVSVGVIAGLSCSSYVRSGSQSVGKQAEGLLQAARRYAGHTTVSKGGFPGKRTQEMPMGGIQ